MRRRRRLAPLLRTGYRMAWWGLTAYSLVARPHLRGVKCVLRDDEGRVLFVRHTYGDRRAWELPGGGARRGEAPLEAARREAREELGIDLEDWTDLGTVETGRARGHLELTLVTADWPAGAALDIDPIEIADAAWYPIGEPPASVGEITRDALTLLD